MHTKQYVLHTAKRGNDPVYFSLISIIDYRYCSWHFGLECYRNVFCKVMPELTIVSASFKVGSLVRQFSRPVPASLLIRVMSEIWLSAE